MTQSSGGEGMPLIPAVGAAHCEPSTLLCLWDMLLPGGGPHLLVVKNIYHLARAHHAEFFTGDFLN
jgi:hypothetical protein